MNIRLAMSVHQTAVSNEFTEKKDTRPHHSEDSISIYDIDFTALSSFDKQWLLLHLLATTALISSGTTSSALLWQMPCTSSSRSALLKLSEECFNTPPQLLNLVRWILLMWLPRAGHRVETRNQSRVMVLLSQFLLFVVAVVLGITTHDTPNSSYGVMLVKSQTTLAS